MRELKLINSDSVSIIDDEDYKKCSKLKWCYCNGRILSSSRIRGKSIFLHRFILSLFKDDGYDVDHINHNSLDNRKSNLRIITHSQNLINSKKRENTTSKYKGVTFHKASNKWRASLQFNKKQYHIGLFNSENEAAIAVNNFWAKYCTEFAVFNDLR